MQNNSLSLSDTVVALATIISRRVLIPFGVADAVCYASVFQTCKDNFAPYFSAMISYSFNNFI